MIMIEDTQPVGDDAIEIRAAVVPWQHVRMMGEDMVATELVLPANHPLRPHDLGAIAGCGHTDVMVRRRPRVAILPTGSELVPPTGDPAPGQVIEYNSIVLGAQVREEGGVFTRWPGLSDDVYRIRAAIREAAAEHDLVLVLAGSSAGSRDFTARAVREEGTLLVHGIAVRPGHPVIIGMVAGVPVIGVPGYPVSAALTGEILIRPLLRQWAGLSAPRRERVRATLTRKLSSPTGDDDFVRVTVGQVGGRMLVTPWHAARGDHLAGARRWPVHVPRFSEDRRRDRGRGHALSPAGRGAALRAGRRQPRPDARPARPVPRAAPRRRLVSATWAAWWACGRSAARRTCPARTCSTPTPAVQPLVHRPHAGRCAAAWFAHRGRVTGCARQPARHRWAGRSARAL